MKVAGILAESSRDPAGISRQWRGSSRERLVTQIVLWTVRPGSKAGSSAT